jgi:hypothetical protein
MRALQWLPASPEPHLKTSLLAWCVHSAALMAGGVGNVLSVGSSTCEAVICQTQMQLQAISGWRAILFESIWRQTGVNVRTSRTAFAHLHIGCSSNTMTTQAALLL